MHVFRLPALALLFAFTSTATAIDWWQTVPAESFCGTQERYDANASPDGTRGGCPQLGVCDNPTNRDNSIPGAATEIKTIRLIIHVFCDNDGTGCLETEASVQQQVDALNADFAPWRIQFVHEVRFQHKRRYLFFTFSDEVGMKTTYGEAVSRNLNVYVVNTPGFSFGTFPWDSDAVQALGGIVMDDLHFAPSGNILAHEVGHNLGLWHTHHGVSEVNLCSPCWESPGDPEGDIVGDRCSDTRPTPTNFSCSNPGGTDSCSATNWAGTDFRNYMSYSNCQTEFTNQQAGRMHCWIDDKLSGWLVRDCPTDLDGNGITDLIDLNILLGNFGCNGPCGLADTNADESVDIQDLAELLSAFGLPC